MKKRRSQLHPSAGALVLLCPHAVDADGNLGELHYWYANVPFDYDDGKGGEVRQAIASHVGLCEGCAGRCGGNPTEHHAWKPHLLRTAPRFMGDEVSTMH